MDKQVFAKIGVFVLLGLNVGAYYVFWPSQSGTRSEAQTPREEKGETKLLPTASEKVPVPAKPREFPSTPVKDAVPLASVTPPPKAENADEAVGKLLDHIQKETEAGDKPAPPFKVVAPPEEPKPLSPLESAPLKDSNTGVTSALTPKPPPSPWQIHRERGTLNQKLLIAKLSQPAVEFRIMSDRIEEKNPGGDLHAVGNVTFTGAGLTGSCQRLTLPFYETRLVFEEQAQIIQDGNPGSKLRGERIVWDVAARPSLGAPK